MNAAGDHLPFPVSMKHPYPGGKKDRSGLGQYLVDARVDEKLGAFQDQTHQSVVEDDAVVEVVVIVVVEGWLGVVEVAGEEGYGKAKNDVGPMTDQ